MLSKREGASKAIYESFFSDVPVILTEANIGVNRDHINKYTGVCSTDEELSQKILFMVENYRSFSPRRWALTHTGYKISNKILNNTIKTMAIINREQWTQDIYKKKNYTNAIYVYENDRKQVDHEIMQLRKYLR